MDRTLECSRSLIRAVPVPAALLLLLGGMILGLKVQGMTAGPGAATTQRIDAPFTLAVRTPHVPWGLPSPGSPIHALVVPSVSEGRTLVELAERFPLTYDTVMMDNAWDVNTWTVGTGKNYEARNYKLLYQYLAEDLTSNNHYDVIVLPALFGWNRLPQAVRDAILKRVEAGAGLVLIHPTTGIPAPDDPKTTRPMNDFAPDYAVSPGGKLWEVSPLVNVLSDRLDDHGYLQVRPDAVTTGPWKSVHVGFITDNVPFNSFPADYLKHYKYRAAEDATVLVEGANGEPIVATKMYGKGRVVALGYLNNGLSPVIGWNFLGKQNDHWWEYFYSLLDRSITWAAKREPQLRLLPMKVEKSKKTGKKLLTALRNSGSIKSAELTASVIDAWGDREATVTREIKIKKGLNRVALALSGNFSAGPQDVDVMLSSGGKHYDWGSVSFSIPKPDQILSVTTDKQFYTLGDPLQVTVRTRESQPAAFRVELWDNRQRLIGTEVVERTQDQADVLRAALRVGNYSTNIGWVRATLLEDHEGQETKVDQKETRVNFVSLDRKFGAYELILPWYGPPSYEPWNHALLSQFRKMGVTVVENPRDNFKIISEVRAPGFGVYWHYRRGYIEQKDNYLRTHDTKYLIREPDLSSHAWLDTLRGDIIRAMQKDLPYRPLAYYLADESSLTAYGDPLDFSWSEPTLQALRQWLRGQYSSLDALNQEWETNFKSWNDVIPLTTEQAQAKADYAGWMDHRTFMEQVFAHAVEVAAETVKSEDPGGLPSISGTQAPGPSNAVNWYLLDHLVGYLQPYSNDDQDDLHRSIHANQILTGFTGYASDGVELRHQLWHRLLHGQTGASLFWQYTAVNSDLTLTQQGRDLEAVTNEFRNEGLALLLRSAQRQNCGIAVHYSLLSVRGHWITDGHIHPGEVVNGDATSANLKRFHRNRTQWLQALRDAGYQYDFLTTEQIDKGNLSNYRVLILPDSIALSEGEVTAIRSFVEKGGLLISDGETGLMDGHARWQNQGLLDSVLGVKQEAEQTAMRAEPKTTVAVELHATLNSKPLDLDIIPANPGLKITTGHAAATSGGTPFLIEHAVGAGRSITLNFWFTQYGKLRKAGLNGPLLSLLESYLIQSDINPIADVRSSGGKPLRCSEITGFRKGDVRYLAILPGLACSDAGEVVLRLPEAEYVYDLRAHHLIGHVATVNGNLVDGEPWFLALSPRPEGKLSIRADASSGGPAQVKAGAAITFDIRLADQAAFCTFPEAVHIDVSDPSGKTIGYYGDNLPLENCGARFSIATALNDAPGKWRVSVREPYTHQTVAATFTVVSR